MANKLPKTECVWLDERDGDGIRFIVTSKENDRAMYFLYVEQDGGFVKLGKNKDPRELEKKFIKY